MKKLLSALLGLVLIGQAVAQVPVTVSPVVVGGQYNSSPPTLLNKQYAPFQFDTSGNLKTTGGGGGASTTTLPLGVTTTPTTVAPTAGTFSSLLVSNSSRKGCFIQNTSASLGYIFPAASGGTTSNSAQVGAGGTFNCSGGGVVITDALTGTCASGTCSFVVFAQ
jgi:hypothetical protein